MQKFFVLDTNVLLHNAACIESFADNVVVLPMAVIEDSSGRIVVAGGRLVINAIRKEFGDRDVLLGLDYETQLWEEKEIKSVANVTRRDVREFLELAAEMVTQGWEFDVELLWRLRRRGYSVSELPIHWADIGNSKLSVWRDPAMILLNLLRLRLQV